MNDYQIYDPNHLSLEIQISFAKNIFLSPMVFERGQERLLALSGETYGIVQWEVIEPSLPMTNRSFVGWSAIPVDAQ